MTEITVWHWLALAVLLGVGELFTFTSYLLCMALAALLTGILLALFPTFGIVWQGLLFAVATLLIAGGWVYYTKHYFNRSEAPLLNHRAQQLIGRTFTLKEPIMNSIGKAQIDGIYWKIKGPDTPAGTQMKVVGVNGLILLVEALSTNLSSNPT